MLGIPVAAALNSFQLFHRSRHQLDGSVELRVRRPQRRVRLPKTAVVLLEGFVLGFLFFQWGQGECCAPKLRVWIRS